MSTFKSFARRGSFADYQVKPPDETGKIKEETSRTIRDRQRGQSFRERNEALYLQAQKLAQGVEENQREQNFKLETENRRAFRDAVAQNYATQIQNEKVQAEQSKNTFKQLSELAPSAFKVYNELEQIDLDRNRKINAQLAYAAGADYNTVAAIQTIGDNLTKSEFAQTDFIRKKIEEGADVDALFALYERRASKGFINNVVVAQNTAYGFENAARIESARFIEEYRKSNNNASPTPAQQKANLSRFEKEYAGNFVNEEGRGLNPDMLQSYVYPIMRRTMTRFNASFEKDIKADQKAKVRNNTFEAFGTAWSTGGSAKLMEELTRNPSKEKFELWAEWATNKSLDFGTSGLSSRDLQYMADMEITGPNGEKTTYRQLRKDLPDFASFNKALNARIRGEKQQARDDQVSLERDAQSRGIELYNQLAADGGISDEDYARSQALDKDSGIPNFESEATKQMAKEVDSVRYFDAYDKLLSAAADRGDTERMRHLLSLKGVGYKLREKYLPLLENADIKLKDQAYKDGVATISSAITEHKKVAKGRVGNKDHHTTLLFKTDQLQQFKNDVLVKGIPIGDAVSGRLGIIKAKQDTPGAINKYGHYTEMVQSQAKGAINYQEALQEDQAFIEMSLTPNFRKDAQTAVNAYGENKFYEDYYPMQRGEVTPRLRRRAAIMGVSPFAAINFLASGLGQPAVAVDAQMQAIADAITPIAGKLINTYRTSGSHPARMEQADYILSKTVAVGPVRGEPVNPTPRQVYDYMRALGVSDIHAKGVLANIRGEVGIDADGRFPTARMGDGGMSGGLFQMYNDRYRKMERAVPNWKTNWRGQVKHALQDDTAPEYLQMNFNSPEEAADWFLENFERPAMEHRPGRRKLNRSFIPQLGF